MQRFVPCCHQMVLLLKLKRLNVFVLYALAYEACLT